ncbi:MAG TPA: 30S ribosomal protein S6 [Sneathiellales bacterium]|nr:30S ribosomal protein S6 [Sneathiellales bacterium]
MPLYEHVFIARRDISSQQVDSLTESLTEIIKDGGGEVKKTEYWGLRSLSYRIKKNRKGHYVLMNIDTPYPALAEMERVLQLNEDIVRTMTIRVDELEEGPSAVMQQKASRDDRGPRREGGRDGDRNSGGPRAPGSDDKPAPKAVAETPSVKDSSAPSAKDSAEAVTDE